MSNKGNIASWTNPEERKKSLADGRKTAFQIKKEKTGCSFDPETILKISINKYTKSGNELALYLINKGINIVSFKNKIRYLNCPGYYKREGEREKALKRIVNLSNSQKESAITIETATELNNKSRERKPVGEYRQSLLTKSKIGFEFNKAIVGLSPEHKEAVTSYIKKLQEAKPKTKQEAPKD